MFLCFWDNGFRKPITYSRNRVNGTETLALITSGRWKSSRMPARYTECQAAERGAVTKYYQEQEG